MGEKIMKIRCDEPMRRSKERASKNLIAGVPQFRCTKKCDTCICGLRQGYNAVWEHINGGKHD